MAYGYVTATVTVFDTDATAADDKLRAVERVIQGRGFVTIPETLNAIDAWLSSIPGHAYANVRQPLISTLNLAHLMPVSAVWAGPERNAHLNGPPLIVTRTDGATPFRLVTHLGDVGHTLIVGPTGMGKSVLLATLALQFRRYPGSRIFAFDMGRSMRATILGLEGEHYDLGTDGSIAFQPLARIDQEGYRDLGGRVDRGPAGPRRHRRRAGREGGRVVGARKSRERPGRATHDDRTLGAAAIERAAPGACSPTCSAAPTGSCSMPITTGSEVADVQGFEMEELMHSKAAVLAVLHYLFARLEERFDGAPTLLILDEAWLFLDDPVFASRIRQWLKTLRKKNVSVVFATQSLADIRESTIAPAIIESCPSRIFLPNPQATEPQIRAIYEGFGLNARQITIVAQAQPKRDYYYQSRLGNRVFDLDLGPVALAFAAASTPEDQRAIDDVLASDPPDGFAAAWLRHRDLAGPPISPRPFQHPRRSPHEEVITGRARRPVREPDARCSCTVGRVRRPQLLAEHPDRRTTLQTGRKPDQSSCRTKRRCWKTRPEISRA